MTSSFLIPGLEIRSLHSKVLKRDLELYVKLPWSYERSDKVYPVLYCTDANRSFLLYSTLSLIFETPGNASPEIFIVGIGYKLDPERLNALARWATWRTYDLTPVNRAEINQWWVDRLSPILGGDPITVSTGGAEVFLKSIREEIIPFIESTYRVSTTDRGLAGYSDGGLFTLYTLFNAPELFMRYFAGSPSMWQQLITDEENYATAHYDLPVKLFITAGANETELLEELLPFVEKLRMRSYPNLNLQTHVFEGEGHSSAYAASVSRALCTLYHDEWRKI